MVTLRKHLLFIQFKFLRALEFRAEIVVWVFLDLLPYLVLFLVWSAIYATTDNLGGLDFSQMLFYYLLVAVIGGLTDTHFEQHRSEEVRLGKIDFFLIKPFSYIKEVLLSDLVGKLFYIILFTPVYFIFFSLSKYWFNFTLPSLTVSSLILVAGLLIMAYFIQALIALLIVLITFWLEGASGLEHFKWITISLFSGAMIPREIMPEWMSVLTNWLPLKYLYAVPIEIIQQRAQFNLLDLLYFTGFLIFLIIIVKFTWSKAVLRYTSAGG